MNNGHNRQINDPRNFGPLIGVYESIGPDIEFGGQTYSSPYTLPATAPTYYNNSWKADFTKGRHPFRVQPRRGPFAPAAEGMGCVGCVGEDKGAMGTGIPSWVIVGALLVGGFWIADKMAGRAERRYARTGRF